MADALSDVLFAKSISRAQLVKKSRLSHATIDRLMAGSGEARRGTRRQLAEVLESNEEEVAEMLKAQRRVRKRNPQPRLLYTAAAICREAATKTGDALAASCGESLLQLIKTRYPLIKIKLKKKPSEEE